MSNTDYDDYRYENTERRSSRRTGDHSSRSTADSAYLRSSTRDTAYMRGSSADSAYNRGSSADSAYNRNSSADSAYNRNRSADSAYGRSGPAGSRYSKSTKPEGNSREVEIPDFLYDARGARVKKSRISNEFLRTLLFFVLPYLVINTIVFLLVTSAPKIEIEIQGTNDYKTTTAVFTVSSLLPLEEMKVTLESEDLPYEKDGSTYTARIDRNGTLYVEATSKNGMRSTACADISELDDTPPVIDESSCHIEEGVLSFKVSDTQSGIDWTRIYATDAEGNRIPVKETDQSTGTVCIQMDTDWLELHVFDVVGNERTATVTATTEQLKVNGPVVE